MKVIMQHGKEEKPINRDVEFNVKDSNGHVIGELTVNKSGITWRGPRKRNVRKIAWEDLQEILEQIDAG